MKFQRFILIQLNSLLPAFYPFFRLILNGWYFKGIIAYLNDYATYSKLNKQLNSPFPVKILNSHPIYFDRYEQAGNVLQHYFHQDIWAARKIYQLKLRKHYDVGSRLDGFIAHVLAFCKVIMLDIRPLAVKVPNLDFIQTDCTNMKNIRTNSLGSVSSLHAIEHFGLGRYGDSVDPYGYKKAIDELKRVVKKGGDIFFSVPIGNQRLEFNNQRVFNPKYVLELFEGCSLVEFSVVNDKNELVEKTKISKYLKTKYSCGLFHFRKK